MYFNMDKFQFVLSEDEQIIKKKNMFPAGNISQNN